MPHRPARVEMVFSAQSDLFAASRRGEKGGWLTDVLRLCDGKNTAEIPTSKGPSALAFDPQARRLAVASTTLEVWPLTERNPVWKANLTNDVTCVAWSRDGEHLVAVASRSAGVAFPSDPVLVLNATDGRIEHSVHLEAGTGVQRSAFHPDGQSIVLTTWSGELLWIPLEGKERRLVREAAPGALAFSGDNRRLAFAPSKSEFGLIDVATSEVWFSWLTTNPPAGSGFTITTSDNGRWLVTANNARVQLWDTETRTEIDVIHIPVHVWFVTVAFGPADASLYYSALSLGVRRVELLKSKASNGRDQVRFGRVEQIGEPGFGMDVIAPDGRSLIVGEHRAQRKNESIPQTMWLWADGNPARARKLTEGWPVAGYRLLRGERWGITTDRVEPDLWIWDAQTGQRVRGLGFTTPVLSEPAPNGRWVLTKNQDGFSVWEVGHWTRIHHWPAHADEIDTFMAVSPDSRLLATIATHNEITLRSLPIGEELIRLPPADTAPR